MVRLGDVMLDPPHSTHTHTEDKRQHTHTRQHTRHTHTVEENKTKTRAFLLSSKKARATKGNKGNFKTAVKRFSA